MYENKIADSGTENGQKSIGNNTQTTPLGRFLQNSNLDKLPILISIAMWGIDVLKHYPAQWQQKRFGSKTNVFQQKYRLITPSGDAEFNNWQMKEFLSLKGHLRLMRELISLNI